MSITAVVDVPCYEHSGNPHSNVTTAVAVSMSWVDIFEDIDDGRLRHEQTADSSQQCFALRALSTNHSLTRSSQINGVAAIDDNDYLHDDDEGDAAGNDDCDDAIGVDEMDFDCLSVHVLTHVVVDNAAEC